MGDPAGVGPEIVVKAWNQLRREGRSIVTNMGNLVGYASIQQAAVKRLWDVKQEETEVVWLLAEKLKAKGKQLEEVSREEAERRIQQINEPYKLEILEGIEEPITIYHLGDEWWDLCAGPHVESTGNLNPKAIELESVAGAYWRGDATKAQLRAPPRGRSGACA